MMYEDVSAKLEAIYPLYDAVSHVFAAARGRNIVRFVGFQHENICEMVSEYKNSHAASKTSDTYIKCQKTLVNT